MDKKKNLQKKEKNKEREKQNIIMKNFSIWIAVVIVAFVLFFIIMNETAKIRYDGLVFEMEKMGQLTLYKTTLPLYRNGSKIADYNFYLRTNPNELKKVPFNGNISVKSRVVFNPNDELKCDGDDVIGVGNIIHNLYGYLNISAAIRDENATCDELGRYTFVNVTVANVTEINQIGNSCYEIKVANCEILKGTERYMLEALVRIKKSIDEKYN
jgi:hypothetical protein